MAFLHFVTDREPLTLGGGQASPDLWRAQCLALLRLIPQAGSLRWSPVPGGGPGVGDLWPGLLLLLLQTARGHRVRDPGRKEGPSGAACAPSRWRTDPSRAGRRHLEEAVPRVEEGGNRQSLHTCPSLRGSGRGCQAWTNRRRQVSGSLPAPISSPLGGISLEGITVHVTPCMPGALPASGMLAPTPSS